MTKDIETPPDDSKKLPIEDQLKGKTLQVYMYMVKRKEPVGVREVQRDLGFSSPSVANYHIDKLVELALVKAIQRLIYLVESRRDVPETGWRLCRQQIP